MDVAALAGPVLGEHREAHMVAPAACNLYVAARIALARESDPLQQCERADVGGLDVRLDTMQAQLPERDVGASAKPSVM